ncbi:Tyrosine-protein kinase SPK-1 [Portunus trituberculatus]|uniref:Tyrosine-protein kinase SPK-1 n=1 Tax=Portunus trituberculatus TaxID=210409 RepID=A0A5B7E597_PORTR|nr:Tyrosine-protein kinase SPK-1 [Portunus trituberculatus]
MVLLLAWHESLQGRARAWTRATMQTALRLVAVLPLVCWMWRRIWQELEAREGDIDFLGRSIPFLREEEMRSLDGGSFLGSGGNDSARLLQWGGAPVVRKEFHHDGELLFMMREARLMLELCGTAGVPRPLALGFQPLTVIQEFVGEPYDKFLMQCSVQGVLRSLDQLCRRLGEVHAQGVVHNDLKVDNITVSGSVHRPVLHVIDLGWACCTGRVAGNFSLETGEEDDFPREGLGAECHWMAPEVRERRSVFASGDVFSLGFMLQQIADSCIQPWLAVPLWRLGKRCAREEPSCRPCLPKVTRALAALRRGLLWHQLQEPFLLMVRQ